MERAVSDIANDVYFYWSDILHEVSTPIGEELKESMLNLDKDILLRTIRSMSSSELDKALNSEDEVIKMYYMQRIWYRYMDVKAGRSIIDKDYVLKCTPDTSIHELEIPYAVIVQMKQYGVDYLFQLPDAIAELEDYTTALLISAAMSMLGVIK